MNLFIKKILAKYVIYVEIIGYGFVVLFVAGLVALSFIKAEDEFIQVEGQYEIHASLIRFPQRQILLEIVAESARVVKPGDKLIEVTDNAKMISDQMIQRDLERQIKTARDISDSDLANTFKHILSEIRERTYPDLKITPFLSPLNGTFFLFKHKNDVIEKNEIAGGIFDFSTARIHVSELPLDRQQKRKLREGQKGTGTLDMENGDSLSFPILLSEVKDDKMVFQIGDIPAEQKQKIASFTMRSKIKTNFNVHISVCVGSKSWMNLIWQ